MKYDLDLTYCAEAMQPVTEPDRFDAEDLEAAHRLIGQIIEAMPDDNYAIRMDEPRKELKALSKSARRVFVLRAVAVSPNRPTHGTPEDRARHGLMHFVGEAIKAKLAFTHDEMAALLTELLRHSKMGPKHMHGFFAPVFVPLPAAIVKWADDHPTSDWPESLRESFLAFEKAYATGEGGEAKKRAKLAAIRERLTDGAPASEKQTDAQGNDAPADESAASIVPPPDSPDAIVPNLYAAAMRGTDEDSAAADAFIETIRKPMRERGRSFDWLIESRAGKKIKDDLKALSKEARRLVALRTMLPSRSQVIGDASSQQRNMLWAMAELSGMALRAALPLADDDFIAALQAHRGRSDEEQEQSPLGNAIPVMGLFTALDKTLKTRPRDQWPAELKAAAHDLVSEYRRGSFPGAFTAAEKARLGRLTGQADRPRIARNEPWGERLFLFLESETKDESAWAMLLAHCTQTEASKPSAKWTKQARERLAALPPGEFAPLVSEVLAAVPQKRTGGLEWGKRDELIYELSYQVWHEAAKVSGEAIQALEPDDIPIGVWLGPFGHHLTAESQALLKGLIWAAVAAHEGDGPADAAIVRGIGAAALSGLHHKVPGKGPRAAKLGNAGVWALGQLPGQDALGQLAVMKIKCKNGSAQKMIAKALDAKAEAMNVSADELEEMSAPSYGLSEVGRREETLGDFTALVSVDTRGKGTLLWRHETGPKAGKTQKSVPAAVKADHADDLKEIKASIKDIAKMLPTQRERIDALMIDPRRWPVAAWRERYLDHPLVGVIARPLIWRFETEASDGDEPAVIGDAIWSDESQAMCDVSGQPLDGWDAAGVRVGLWHPLDSDEAAVQAWRDRLIDLRLAQPFKQAYREVYVLTPAEERTETYSNRFAAHIVRQHQCNALAKSRGWKATVNMAYDGGDGHSPHLAIPSHGLAAEFRVDAVADWDAAAEADFMTETGAYRLLATDQVRFFRIEDADRLGGWGGPTRGLPLVEIPPRALSEVFRDVDLMVGVAGVGGDPTWQDGGPEGRFRDYWEQASFGDLTQTAQTRRDVLARLLPRLAIGPQCELHDRFLHVTGTRHTYKIHLGSGNILIAPADRYLCIVPGGQREADDVWLPFEDDRTLSVILSKAMLLAADDQITDKTILAQL